MSLVDAQGVEKVVNVLKADALRLRLAETEDARAIFQWRNHPLVRINSSNEQKISWEEHQKWFEKRLTKNDGPILIGEVNGKPLGVVRFDISNHEATVSIYLVPESGFKGWGGCFLDQAESWLRQYHPEVAMLHAQVLPNNEPSQKLFSKLNYTLSTSQAQLTFTKVMETCT
jgi:RimJ/RimL family protein N-acetyltransferase